MFMLEQVHLYDVKTVVKRGDFVSRKLEKLSLHLISCTHNLFIKRTN